MKDWPLTYRLAILAVLLFLLLFILRQFWKQPGELPVEKAAVNEVVGENDSEFQERELYPLVPAELPDLNDNYLFNSERSFDEEIQTPTSIADEEVDLEEINYTGSMIVGDMRKALITYQDSETVVGNTSAPAGRRGARPQRASSKTVTKNKQLTLGENFRGYKVDKIEPDRLVLKKGDEMIVKLLYDSGEDRSGVGELIRSQPSQAQPSQAGGATPGRPVPRRPGAPQNSGTMTPPANNTTPPGERTIRSRSELLRGLDPNFGAPSSPGMPGDPLRR